MCEVSADWKRIGGDTAQSQSDEVFLWCRAEHREFHGNSERVKDSGRGVVVGHAFGHKELHRWSICGEDRGAIVDRVGGVEEALEDGKDRVKGGFGGFTITDDSQMNHQKVSILLNY